MFNKISAMCGIVFGVFLLSACSSGSASPNSNTLTGPSAGSGSNAAEINAFDGHWSGTSTQGMSLAFVVANNRVTEITVDYRVGTCTGTEVFSNVSLGIGPYQPNLPNLPPAPPVANSFEFTSNVVGGTDYTHILGSFSGTTKALGTILLGFPQGCYDAAVDTWTATRQ
jgi:hypothetical protein